MATDIELLIEIRDLLKSLVAQGGAKAGHSEAASDRDLDGKYGNPTVKMKDPRDWSGPSMVGRTFSECPAEYLDLVAERFDYFAGKAEAENKMASNGKPEAAYKRLDAARARGWAKRIRGGYVAPTTAPDAGEDWGQDSEAKW